MATFLNYSTQKLSSDSTTLLSVSWSLTSSESLNFTASSTVPKDNVDKTDNWGHFSNGIVIADVATSTNSYICSSGYSCDSWSFKHMHLSSWEDGIYIVSS